MQFRIRWFDPQLNAVQEEVLSATDAAQARAMAEQRAGLRGGIVLSARPYRATVVERAPVGAGGRHGRLDVAWWCRELRTLVGAGMTVVEALETVNAQSLGSERAEVNGALLARLHEGKSLSVAMGEAGAFPAVLIAGIRASERTSSLEAAIDEYLRYDEVLQRLRKQVISAAIYPAVVVGLGLVIVAVLLLVVMPRFAQIYRDMRGHVSWTTSLLVSTSGVLEHHGVLTALGAAAIVLALFVAWRTGALLRNAMALVGRIEPLQKQLDHYRTAKLYQSLALMFRGGYPLDEALAQCAQLDLGPRMAPGIATAQAALARGVGVSQAFEEAGLTDTVSARLLAVGERSGNFDRVLTTIGERHAGKFSTFVERSTRIAEPALLLLVALVVGGVVLMMYMPVFDIASTVG